MNNIKRMFYELINSSLNDTLKTFTKELREHTSFKYASDINEKINFLKSYKDEVIPINVNPYSIKGVTYLNGEFNINESELNDLIDIHGVNLKEVKSEILENENDKTKPFAWRSHSIVTSTLDCSLKLQIINELINDLNFSKNKSNAYTERHLDIFYPWGYEIFKHLADNFEHKKPTIKFSIIHSFLIKHIKGTQEQYREFCTQQYPQEFNETQFSRIDQSNSVKDQLEQNKPHLTNYYNEIIELKKIEFS